MDALAAMPQAASPLPSQGSTGAQSGPSNLDATAQFALLVETGADAAMALVSRAVAAATRTSTTAAPDAATQELVKTAIREHLKDAGLIPAAHPGDPPATPVPLLPPNGPGGAHVYVNEVLSRARNTGGTTIPADWSGMDQDEFRAAIMKEYHFELLAEGQDWFTGHRRGYDFFKTNYIDVHNARKDKGFDVVYPSDSKVMLLPIPSDEINTNQKISGADQNPGY